MMYKLIGIAVVKLVRYFIRHEAAVRKPLIAGAATVTVLTVAAATAGYLLTRDTPEA